MVRQGLKMMIESDSDMLVAGEAGNGKEAVALCENHIFDVVVLDIRMPEMNGLEAARIIRSRNEAGTLTKGKGLPKGSKSSGEPFFS